MYKSTKIINKGTKTRETQRCTVRSYLARNATSGDDRVKDPTRKYIAVSQVYVIKLINKKYLVTNSLQGNGQGRLCTRNRWLQKTRAVSIYNVTIFTSRYMSLTDSSTANLKEQR